MKAAAGSLRTSLVRRDLLIMLIAVGVCMAWSYRDVLADLWQFWQKNDDYSVGQFVIPTGLIIALLKCRGLPVSALRTEPLGLIGLLSAQLLRWWGVQTAHASLERYSLVLSIAFAVLFICGRRVF